MNGSFSVCECRLNGGDIQWWWRNSNLTCCNQIHLNVSHFQVGGAKTRPFSNKFANSLKLRKFSCWMQ